jgi:nitrate reductase NapE component
VRMSSPHLQRKLKEALGADAGAELAAVTDRIDPIRGDIAELRAQIAELRQEMLQGFAAIPALKADLEGQIQKSAEEQTRFFFLAWGMLLVAIVGLYGTLVALLR